MPNAFMGQSVLLRPFSAPSAVILLQHYMVKVSPMMKNIPSRQLLE